MDYSIPDLLMNVLKSSVGLIMVPYTDADSDVEIADLEEEPIRVVQAPHTGFLHSGGNPTHAALLAMPPGKYRCFALHLQFSFNVLAFILNSVCRPMKATSYIHSHFIRLTNSIA